MWIGLASRVSQPVHFSQFFLTSSSDWYSDKVVLCRRPWRCCSRLNKAINLVLQMLQAKCGFLGGRLWRTGVEGVEINQNGKTKRWNKWFHIHGLKLNYNKQPNPVLVPAHMMICEICATHKAFKTSEVSIWWLFGNIVWDGENW